MRSFGLLTIGLEHATKSEDPDETFQRFERLWVFATEIAAGANTPVDRYPGSRRALRILNRGEPHLTLTEPVLDRQLSTGLWGAYRRSAVHFGLIEPTLRGATRPSGHRLTAAGHRVRRAAWAEVHRGNGQLGHWLRVGRVDRDAPSGWLRVGEGCSRREAAALGLEFRRVDREAGRPLGRLCDVFASNGQLDLDRLPLRQLTSDQADAVRAARSIQVLMNEVEEPFRRWMSGDRPPTAAHLRRTAALKEWGVLLHNNEADLEQLQRLLEQRPSIETVLARHAALCAQRGARPWTRPDAGKAYLEPPDFGLTAPRSLFKEGLRA